MTVEAMLSEGSVYRTSPLMQYDQGQSLHITGVDLPAAYLAEFSNAKCGVAEQMSQTTATVDIPDKYLMSGDPIYVWIVVVGNDQRTTRYSVVIPVHARGVPDVYTPSPSEQTAIEAAIDALENTADSLTEIIAPEFVQATANDVGTYVINSDDLYELPNGHTANTTWANTTKTQTTVSAELKKIKDAVAAFEVATVADTKSFLGIV